MAEHTLNAAPAVVHWGFYDASLPPVLSVRSGDRLRVRTEPAAPAAFLSLLAQKGSEAFKRIASETAAGPAGHILNGPVFVEGARPGDALEIFFEEIRLVCDWGFNAILPGKGGLAEDFPAPRCVIVDLDQAAMRASWGAGFSVPLAPFFGNIGVAPLSALGRVSSAQPGAWGGNLDNKELVAGTKLFLPVFNEGALFSIGDGHACQGDGEADSFAAETGLEGLLRLNLRKDLKLELPRAETPTHYILMGFDPSLDQAAKAVLREAVGFLASEKGLSREDAYALCSLAGDMRITQIVNGLKGVHLLLAKALFD